MRITPPITQPAINVENYDIKPHFLTLVQQNQFGSSSFNKDACMHALEYFHTDTHLGCQSQCCKTTLIPFFHLEGKKKKG
jgi:hypothetical protein